VIQKASEPIARTPSNSQFSIKAALVKKEEVKKDEFSEIKDENLPSNHFSQTDVDTEWNIFLRDLAKTNTFVFNAISSFKLEKTDEHQITVRYSSSTAKAEFDRLSIEFFNHFRHKVNNFKIEVEYITDMTIKKEVMTKRKMFEKFVEINPLLKDLDDLMRFDLT
jgi:DNA polymerase-3 subunit gamma/tau